MFVDSHCHLDRLKQSPEALAETLNFARTRGVEHFLCVCVSVTDYDSMLETVKSFDDVSVSCGVHPLHQEDACTYQELLEKAQDDAVVAIGETGLDYFYSPESKTVQLTSFVDHIKVANETKNHLLFIPVMPVTTPLICCANTKLAIQRVCCIVLPNHLKWRRRPLKWISISLSQA